MASIFKQKWSKKNLHDGSTVCGKSAKWYIEYRDHNGRLKRVVGYRDKAATLQKAAELERLAERIHSGKTDLRNEQQKRPLSEHVAAWHQSLVDSGTTDAHSELSRKRVETIIAGIKATLWQEIENDKVSSYLAKRRRGGLSAESSNHYLRRVKQFCSWMVRSGKAHENPLASLKLMNSQPDAKKRRALTAEELRLLFETVEKSEPVFGVAGVDRAMLYRFAVQTGLRANEIRSLRTSSLVLDGTPPSVRVKAAASKNRRECLLPLRNELAIDLKSYLQGQKTQDPAFVLPHASNVARMLKADLRAAWRSWVQAGETKAEKRDRALSGFLRAIDSEGRVVDFHALRHTFVTNLAKGGVHPKVAQQLARHSTITLTMDRYSHAVPEDLAKGLEALPVLGKRPEPASAQKAESVAEESKSPPPSKANPLTGLLTGPLTGMPYGLSLVGSGSVGKVPRCRHRDTYTKANTDRAPDASCRLDSPQDADGDEMGALGLEPRTHGLKGRCSTD